MVAVEDDGVGVVVGVGVLVEPVGVVGLDWVAYVGPLDGVVCGGTVVGAGVGVGAGVLGLGLGPVPPVVMPLVLVALETVLLEGVLVVDESP